MNDLYNGDLPQEKLQTALDELEEITIKLQAFSPDKVVWDFDNIEKRPPWGDNINSEITDLSNYFVTSDGEDLITILHHAIEKGMALGQNVKITKMQHLLSAVAGFIFAVAVVTELGKQVLSAGVGYSLGKAMRYIETEICTENIGVGFGMISGHLAS